MSLMIRAFASFALLLIVPGIAYSQSASAADCVNSLSTKSSARELIGCLQEISLQLEQRDFQLRRTLATLDSLERTRFAGVPTGAVVAFDLRNGCPVGWTPYAAAAGRTVLGAGSGNQDENSNFLTKRDLGDTGGEEYVALTEAQMPKHRHEIPTASHDRSRSDFTFANHDSGLVVPSLDYRHRHTSKGGNIRWTVGGSGEVQGVFPAGGTAAGALGTAEPHQNMPPYIALYFCKKD